jgi:hypothetical protein
MKLVAAMVQDQDAEKVLGALMESRRRYGSANQRCLPDGGGGKAKLRAHIGLAKAAVELSLEGGPSCG